jgi:hypothetical protein
MARPTWLIVLLVAGCVGPEQHTATVASNPFGHIAAPPPVTQASYAPPPVEIAARVDTIGQRVLKANPQIGQVGVHPRFQTIGSPQPELFHRGALELDVTEGLVRQCANDSQLAALLAHELSKMVAEREEQAGPRFRLPDKSPPVELRIGNDAGSFGGADQTYRAEQGFYEKEYQRRAELAQKASDPQVLARLYMTNSGFAATDLDAIAPLLRTAADNQTFAKQLLTPAQSSH